MNISDLSNADLVGLEHIGAALYRGAMPVLLDVLAERQAEQLRASQPGQIQEFEPIQQRDYRKECWIAVYAAAISRNENIDASWTIATRALSHFDERFKQ